MKQFVFLLKFVFVLLLLSGCFQKESENKSSHESSIVDTTSPAILPAVLQSDTVSMILQFNTGMKISSTCENNNPKPKVFLPLSGTVDVIVNWGDNSIDTIKKPGIYYHTYEKDGVYWTTIGGTLTHFGVENYSDIPATDFNQLEKVISFGNIGITNLTNAFMNAHKLKEVPTVLPKEITTLKGAFKKAYSFNQNIGDWDVSNVTNMKYMFISSHSFNQPIGDWDVSNVTNMRGMFMGAKAFNQVIGKWDVSNVSDMSHMFCHAKSFNQPIKDWDVSNVTDLGGMFMVATSFNQPIGTWDVSNVTEMGLLFCVAKSFNQDIGQWDVSNVTDMTAMFTDAYSFNQDLSTWNIRKVTNFKDMFLNAKAFSYDPKRWGWDIQ